MAVEDWIDGTEWWGEPHVRELRLQLDQDSLRLYWTTKDNQRIFIEDMKTSHIENIIRADIAGKLSCDEMTQNRFLLELSIRRQRGER